MAFGINKTRLTPIAIDFGADAIKLLQLERAESDRLIAAACAVLPQDARSDLGARLAFLEQALRNLLRQHPFRGRRAIISIPAFQTLVLHLEVPGAEKNDLDAQANLHIQTRLNLNPAAMVVRHQHVGSMARDGKPVQKILTTAAPRDTVMRYLDLAQHCKLEVAGMHAEPACIVRAFAEVYNRRADDATRTAAFIDLGAAATKLVIAHGYEPVFARNIHAGGDQLTHTEAKAQKIGFMEARLGRVAQAAGVAVANAAALAADAPATLALEDRRADLADGASLDHECFDTLHDEINLALRYYDEAFPGKPVEALVFCGGEANHTDVCRALAKRLGIAAQLGDPFCRLQRGPDVKPCPGLDPGSPQPGWAVPYGLCVSEANL